VAINNLINNSPINGSSTSSPPTVLPSASGKSNQKSYTHCDRECGHWAVFSLNSNALHSVVAKARTDVDCLVSETRSVFNRRSLISTKTLR
jgi:hypothetical protein